MLGPGRSGVTCHVAGALAPAQSAGLWDCAELQGGLSASRSHGGCRGSPGPVWLTGTRTLYPGAA